MGIWDEHTQDDDSTDSKNGETQSKSLIGNTYSDVTHMEEGEETYKYKDISDWDVNADLAYELTKAEGAVRQFASSRAAYQDREEFYSDLQIAIGHALAASNATGSQRAEKTLERHGEESRGLLAVMEFFGVDVSDIVEFLSNPPEYVDMGSDAVQQFAPVLDQNREFAQTLFDTLAQTDWIEEPEAASADD